MIDPATASDTSETRWIDPGSMTLGKPSRLGEVRWQMQRQSSEELRYSTGRLKRGGGSEYAEIALIKRRVEIGSQRHSRGFRNGPPHFVRKRPFPWEDE